MKTQTFGLEVETTGLGRERTARAIAAHFGTRGAAAQFEKLSRRQSAEGGPANHRFAALARYVGAHLDNWEVPMPDGRHWTVEHDSSVTDPDAEVVSPVCHIRTVRVVARARCSGMTKPDICHASSRSASDLHRLLRLGFIGDEFETARLHLTKKLDGNGAWRSAH